MEKKKKKKPWIRFRHRVVTAIAYVLLAPYSCLRYGVRVKRFRQAEKRPYLILLNHQTPFDQFFVGMAFDRPIYYVATEDIFSMGFVSSLLRYLVAPIPIKKQSADARAVITCIRVAKEGGTIAIAPEGNRTYSGRTEYINPAIVKLARGIKMPIALFRIEGGYGVHPRWSDVVRRGKMRGYVSGVIQPEEYAELSDEELYSRICEGLFVDEACADGEFKHAKRAEYLERAMYICPHHGLSEFYSRGDTVTCKRCGCSVRYGTNKELTAVRGEFPFRFVAEWYDYQKEFINRLDPTLYTGESLYRDTVELYEVIPYKHKVRLAAKAELALYGDRLTMTRDGETEEIPFDDIRAVAVLGRNKLNMYRQDRIFQIKGDKRFNALKYIHFYHRYKNYRNGDVYDQFLGL